MSAHTGSATPAFRFAVGTNAFTRVPLEEAIRRAARLGFDGVDVLADAPHAFPLPLPRGRVALLRHLLESNGVRACAVNANTVRGFWTDPPPDAGFEPSLSSPDPCHRAWRIAFTKHAIDLARDLGAGTVTLTAGRVLSHPDTARAHFLAALRDVLAHARERGVRVAIEYEPALLVETAAEVMDVLREVADPLLGVNVDVAHAVVNREDPARLVHAFRDRVFHVHAADVPGRKHHHLVPGEGSVHWDAFFHALRSVGYDGDVALELYTYAHAPDAACAAGLKHVQKSADRGTASGGATRHGPHLRAARTHDFAHDG